jgi:hypothetical protein
MPGIPWGKRENAGGTSWKALPAFGDKCSVTRARCRVGSLPSGTTHRTTLSQARKSFGDFILRTDRSIMLKRLTLDFIRRGERAIRRFSAAANLAEFGCPADLAQALLAEVALGSGLPHRAMSVARSSVGCFMFATL